MSWLGKLFSFGKREAERVAMANLFQAFEGDSRNFEQLDRHLLVVGQSGSGKSYFIGKMVEELAMKTRARVVILDRAGDFVKIVLSSDEKNLSGLFAAVHSQWSDEKFQEQLGEQFQMFQFHRLAVHPYWFDALDLCAVFGLPHIFAMRRAIPQNSAPTRGGSTTQGRTYMRSAHEMLCRCRLHSTVVMNFCGKKLRIQNTTRSFFT